MTFTTCFPPLPTEITIGNSKETILKTLWPLPTVAAVTKTYHCFILPRLQKNSGFATVLKHTSKRFPMLKHTNKRLSYALVKLQETYKCSSTQARDLQTNRFTQKIVWVWTLDIQSVAFSIQISYRLFRLLRL